MKLDRGERWLARAAFALMVAQVLLVVASWLVGALAPEWGCRSLLDGEGIRWFCGHFARMVGGYWMACLLLLGMASGCMAGSGLADALRRLRRLTLRERSALSLTAFFAVAYVAVVMALTLPRRAVLVAADGNLWPSPFCEALVPMVAFGLTVSALVYGWVVGRINTLVAAWRSLVAGIRMAAPLMLFYVFLMQFCSSLVFVLL